METQKLYDLLPAEGGLPRQKSSNNINNNNNNNNHFILGQSVSPSKLTHDGNHPLYGGSWGHAYQPHLPIPAFPPYALKTLYPGMRTLGNNLSEGMASGQKVRDELGGRCSV